MAAPRTFPVLVARVGRPHGVRGEVTVELLTDDPAGRLTVGARLTVEADGTAAPDGRGELVVTDVHEHRGIWRLAFEGIADRESAEALRGMQLSVPATFGEHADEDAWYVVELIGLQVEDPAGAVIGRVTAVVPGPAQDLLDVELAAGGSAYVPFVAAIVPVVDMAHRRIVVDAPPGLLELGR